MSSRVVHDHRTDFGQHRNRLAMVPAVKGLSVILVMPDSMSVERRRLILAYGADSS